VQNEGEWELIIVVTTCLHKVWYILNRVFRHGVGHLVVWRILGFFYGVPIYSEFICRWGDCMPQPVCPHRQLFCLADFTPPLGAISQNLLSEIQCLVARPWSIITPLANNLLFSWKEILPHRQPPLLVFPRPPRFHHTWGLLVFEDWMYLFGVV